MGTAVNHPSPDRLKPSFVIFDFRALPGRQSARVSKNNKLRLNPVWRRMFYSPTHVATVGVRGLKPSLSSVRQYGWIRGDYVTSCVRACRPSGVWLIKQVCSRKRCTWITCRQKVESRQTFFQSGKNPITTWTPMSNWCPTRHEILHPNVWCKTRLPI